MNTELTNISELDSYKEFKEINDQRNNYRQNVSRVNQEMEDAHLKWKQKKQELQKALENPNSKLQQTEEIEEQEKQLKTEIDVFKQRLNELKEQATPMQAFTEKSNAFVSEAVPVVNSLCEKMEQHLEEALKICEEIAANEVLANTTPLKNIPYIHPAKDFIHKAAVHLQQSRAKWNATYNRKTLN